MTHQSILVTGGAGFIGGHLVEHLRHGVPNDVVSSRTIVVLDRLTYAGTSPPAGSLQHSLDASPESWHLQDSAARSGLGQTEGSACDVQFVRGDVRDGELLRRLFEVYRFGTVFHLAAETHVDRSIDDPSIFFASNTSGTFSMLEEARRFWQSLPSDERSAFRFINVSTDEVYGAAPEPMAFDESAAYRPSSPYAASKASADLFADSYFKTFGLPTITLHGSNTFGPRQFPEKLIPLMTLNALDARALPLYGSGRQVRDWLYVDDHVSGILAAWQYAAAGEHYNLGADNPRENEEVVLQICNAVDNLTEASAPPARDLIQYVADRPGHDERYAIDSRKAAKRLGWSPTEDFAERLEMTVGWYAMHRDWSAEILSRSRYDRTRLGLSE